MIDIRKLKELVKLMVQNDLTEMDLRDSEEQVTLQRPNQWSSPQAQAPVAAAAPPPVVAATAPPPMAEAPPPQTAAAPDPAPPGGDRTGLIAIESPMGYVLLRLISRCGSFYQDWRHDLRRVCGLPARGHEDL